MWWAALTPSLETGGVVGHIDYREPFPDTGKLSDDTFTYDGIGREIDAVYLDRTGHFQIWVDSGNGSALPNDLVLHVGSASMTLGSATPIVRDDLHRRHDAHGAGAHLLVAGGVA